MNERAPRWLFGPRLPQVRSRSTISDAASVRAKRRAHRARLSKDARVAVIGGGPSGVVAARYLMEKSFMVDGFEATDELGGVWVYRGGEKGRRGGNAMYAGLVSNLPFQVMEFSDFQYESESPTFKRASEVARYVQSYADRFGVRERFQFNQEVVSVVNVPPSSPPTHKDVFDRWDTKWRVTTRSPSGDHSTQTYDAVVVCNGHHTTPSIPHFRDGADLSVATAAFPGNALHSVQYDRPDAFAHQSVAIVGAGSSAIDIANELRGVASRLHIVTHHPEENAHSSGEGQRIMKEIHKFDDENDAVGHGTTTMVNGSIESFDRDGHLTFHDGSRTDVPIDAVIFCTGYQYHFPFLSGTSGIRLAPDVNLPSSVRHHGDVSPPPNIRGGGDEVDETKLLSQGGSCVQPMYRNVWTIEEPSLCFVGLTWKAPTMPLFELQAKAVSSVLAYEHGKIHSGDGSENGDGNAAVGNDDASHHCALPSVSDMKNELNMDMIDLASKAVPIRFLHNLSGNRLTKHIGQLQGMVYPVEDATHWNSIIELYNITGKLRRKFPSTYKTTELSIRNGDVSVVRLPDGA